MDYSIAQISTCRKVACVILPRAGMAVSYHTCTREGNLALTIIKSALENRCWVEVIWGGLPILFGKWGEDCRIDNRLGRKLHAIGEDCECHCFWEILSTGCKRSRSRTQCIADTGEVPY